MCYFVANKITDFYGFLLLHNYKYFIYFVSSLYQDSIPLNYTLKKVDTFNYFWYQHLLVEYYPLENREHRQTYRRQWLQRIAFDFVPVEKTVKQ